MSHGGSGRQARAVIDGLEADLVSLALAADVDALAREAQLVPADWATKLPHGGVPWFSTIVFVVRQGNPKNVRDWPDLVSGDVQVVMPNPKTSGGARWTYLAAWGSALHRSNGDEAQATAFVRSLLARVPVLDTGARGASVTFTQQRIGDVLLTWENEAYLLTRENPGLEIVRPSESIRAEPVLAVVERNVQRHGTSEVARAYADFMYTADAQEIAAQHHFRAQDEQVATRHRSELPEVHLFTIADVGGDWARIHARHFENGALFDQMMEGRPTR